MGQLWHTACSQFSQAGAINASSFSIDLNRPARPAMLKMEFASNIPATVQIRVQAADGTMLFTSGIFVVGTATARKQWRLPSSEWGQYATATNVVLVGIGSHNASVVLATSFQLLMQYGGPAKSLC